MKTTVVANAYKETFRWKMFLKSCDSYNSTWIQIFCIQQHWKIKSTNSFISQIFVLKTFLFVWYKSVVVPTSSFSTLVACIITDISKHLSAHKAPMKKKNSNLRMNETTEWVSASLFQKCVSKCFMQYLNWWSNSWNCVCFIAPYN